MLYWEGGSIVVEGTWQDHCYFACDFRQFFVSHYSTFNWWYLYIYSQYLCYANVSMISSDLVTFSTVFMFVMISLMNYANTSCIIVDLCWFWFADICHVINLVLSSINICDLRVYCVILFKLWISSEYFQEYQHSSLIGNLIPG